MNLVVYDLSRCSQETKGEEPKQIQPKKLSKEHLFSNRWGGLFRRIHLLRRRRHLLFDLHGQKT